MIKKLIRKFNKSTPPIIDFQYENSHYNRISLISRAIISTQKESSNYLEIGVQQCNCFNSIPLGAEFKTGVDPAINEDESLRKMTSDDFFKSNKKKFDVIFIDGLHHYEQVFRDLKNSLDYLNKGGIILIHDMLPRCEIFQKVPRISDTWNGDVWKLSMNLINSKNINFIIADFDHGVGILKPKPDYKLDEQDKRYSELKYDDYVRLRNSLPIKSADESFDFIDNK